MTFIHAFFFPDLYEGPSLGWLSLGVYVEMDLGPPGAGTGA